MSVSFPSLLHLPEKPTHASLQLRSGVTCLLQLYPVLNPTLPYALHASPFHHVALLHCEPSAVQEIYCAWTLELIKYRSNKHLMTSTTMLRTLKLIGS